MITKFRIFEGWKDNFEEGDTVETPGGKGVVVRLNGDSVEVELNRHKKINDTQRFRTLKGYWKEDVEIITKKNPPIITPEDPYGEEEWEK
jgi:preprotein translocase subunit YajC